MRPLVVPPAAQRDENAIQMLSAWIAEEGLHCTLNVGMWHAQGRPEAESWGIVLADVVRHLANALHEDLGSDVSKSIDEIVASLIRELEDPTSEAEGEFHPGHT
jgi:hypothetical protein